jgi:hypothetical protein
MLPSCHLLLMIEPEALHRRVRDPYGRIALTDIAGDCYYFAFARKPISREPFV